MEYGYALGAGLSVWMNGRMEAMKINENGRIEDIELSGPASRAVEDEGAEQEAVPEEVPVPKGVQKGVGVDEGEKIE